MIHQMYTVGRFVYLYVHLMLERLRLLAEKVHLGTEPSSILPPLRQAPAQDYSPFEVFGCRRAFWIASR
jgi:hypothetical protein